MSNNQNNLIKLPNGQLIRERRREVRNLAQSIQIMIDDLKTATDQDKVNESLRLVNMLLRDADEISKLIIKTDVA